MVGLRGAGGVKNFCVGICDGPPSTARSSFNLGFYISYTNGSVILLCECLWTTYLPVGVVELYICRILWNLDGSNSDSL